VRQSTKNANIEGLKKKEDSWPLGIFFLLEAFDVGILG
jgi:hypothetical protein